VSLGRRHSLKRTCACLSSYPPPHLPVPSVARGLHMNSMSENNRGRLAKSAECCPRCCHERVVSLHLLLMPWKFGFPAGFEPATQRPNGKRAICAVRCVLVGMKLCAAT
jgi:hypothetical protein